MFEVEERRRRIVRPQINLLGEAVSELERLIRRQIDEDLDELVLDLRDVDAIDSYALSALIGARSELARVGAQLRVVNMNESVRNVLSLTRLDELLGIGPDD